MVGFHGTQDGGDFRNLQMADTGELVHDLLLFEGNLHGIGKCLPGTAAAVPEMRAEGREPMRGRRNHPGNVALRIAAPDFVDLYVHDVPRNAGPDEEDFPVHVCQAVSFRSRGFDQNILKIGFFIPSHFHANYLAKIRKEFRIFEGINT